MRGLSFPQRLKLTAKALLGSFDASAAQQAHGLLGGILSGSGSMPERSTAELLDTFNTSPWVRACAGKVADSLAAVHWRLFVMRSPKTGQAYADQAIQKGGLVARRAMLKQAREDGDAQEVKTHLLLDVLRDANPIMTGYELRWLTSVWLDLVGDCFYVKQRNTANAPGALWPVPPHWVAETPTPSKPYYRMAWRGWQVRVPDSEVVWLQNPNPVDPYGRGSGIGRALDDEIALDEYAAKHTTSFFRNNARPDLLIMPKDETGLLSEADRDRLEQWWTEKLQGYWRRFKPLFLTRPLQVTMMEQNFRNMQLAELRQQEADIILQVWGVSPEIFGRLVASNRSTIQEAPRIFGRYVLEPRLERWRQVLQARLVPEYDQRLILEYDSPVPEDREFSLGVMRSQPGAFQLNEFRRLAGAPPDPSLDQQYGQGASAGPTPSLGGEEARALVAQMDDAQLIELLEATERRR